MGDRYFLKVYTLSTSYMAAKEFKNLPFALMVLENIKKLSSQHTGISVSVPAFKKTCNSPAQNFAMADLDDKEFHLQGECALVLYEFVQGITLELGVYSLTELQQLAEFLALVHVNTQKLLENIPQELWKIEKFDIPYEPLFHKCFKELVSEDFIKSHSLFPVKLKLRELFRGCKKKL